MKATVTFDTVFVPRTLDEGSTIQDIYIAVKKGKVTGAVEASMGSRASLDSLKAGLKDVSKGASKVSRETADFLKKTGRGRVSAKVTEEWFFGKGDGIWARVYFEVKYSGGDPSKEGLESTAKDLRELFAREYVYRKINAYGG